MFTQDLCHPCLDRAGECRQPPRFPDTGVPEGASHRTAAHLPNRRAISGKLRLLEPALGPPAQKRDAEEHVGRCFGEGAPERLSTFRVIPLVEQHGVELRGIQAIDQRGCHENRGVQHARTEGLWTASLDTHHMSDPGSGYGRGQSTRQRHPEQAPDLSAALSVQPHRTKRPARCQDSNDHECRDGE